MGLEALTMLDKKLGTPGFLKCWNNLPVLHLMQLMSFKRSMSRERPHPCFLWRSRLIIVISIESGERVAFEVFPLDFFKA